jgi:DNA repair protein RecO (recombination protein O)
MRGAAVVAPDLPVEKSSALVLRAVEFGETSAVVTLYGRRLGKVRALAKGAWRPKGSFDGGLDLLSTAQVLVLRKASGGLDLLTEACLEHRFRVGTSLAAVSTGMYVAELLDALTAEADPHPELYDAVHASLRECSGSTADDDRVALVAAHAELAMLRLTGHGPALDRCAGCGRPSSTLVRTAFGLLDGGILCGRCRRGRRAVVSLSAPALDQLRRLAGCPTIPEGSLPAPLGAEVRAVMNALVSHLLDRAPGAARWLPHQPAPRRRRSS